MKYSDIVNFDPIETIIQLKDANDEEKAKSLTESYVMSDEMAEKLDEGILKELQFEEVVDNKGVLIVGNYGTGKSHLMSVISSIVYNKENINHLQNKKFAELSKKVAGKFEVLRIEIGSVSNSLRNIVVSEIERDLKNRGINYSFPSAKEITNNKESLLEMMSYFEKKYPDKGYLLVIDELLDYLKTRKEHEIMLDLGFLRELGEFIKNSRFRLICGIQEQLFDNPTFSFVSKSLNRVKDRFEQVIIRKEDTAYVVSERILSKTPEQKAMVREHLLKFCSLYTEMSERLEEYVQLYPIHPSYIEIFNKIYIAEKREVLKTISLTIKKILVDEVNNNTPGIISFDTYWQFIRDNYAKKSIEDVKEVMKMNADLVEKVDKMFPKAAYKKNALKIINALSVHRLTTNGIDVKIGLTAENLKDDLCLFIENLPEMEPDFLISVVQTVIKDIKVIVNGEYIENNEENGQYFLNKDITFNYEAMIEKKANIMDDFEFNKYYYKIIYDLLDWEAEQYVPNFEIYEYILNWDTHNVYREGYLFMGIPSKRSTAQPPRDFYIYFISPYGDRNFSENKKSDEVMFELLSDEFFYSNIKLYSAAKEMKILTTNQKRKKIYNDISDRYRKKIQKWLNENRNTCFNVVFKGDKKQLIEATGGKSRLTSDFKSAIDLASSIAFDEYFEKKYCDFPEFNLKITGDNKASILARVIKSFSGKFTEDVLDYLDSFSLIKNKKIDVSNSKYANYIIKKMENLKPQGVLNRSDIVEEEYDRSYIKEFKINLEYFLPVFLSLVQTGDITINLNDGKLLSASNLENTIHLGIEDLYEFRFLAKPKQASLKELKRLFEVIDIPSGMAVNTKELQSGLDNILQKTSEWASDAIKAKRILNEEFNLWGEDILPEHIVLDLENKIDIVIDELGNFKNKYNTIAKISNLNLTIEQIEEIEKGIDSINIVQEYEKLKNKCESITNYISVIETLEIPQSMSKDITKAKEIFREQRDSIKDRNDSHKVSNSIVNMLNDIKKEYIEFYIDKHQKVRLNYDLSSRIKSMRNSKKLTNLNRLKNIESVFSQGRLNEFEKRLNKLKICYELEPKELENNPICRHCKFKDLNASGNVDNEVESLEIELDEIYSEWEHLLNQYIEDPMVLENKELLDKENKKIIDEFIKNKVLPETIGNSFVNAFNLLFSELEKITISVNEMNNQLLKAGPLTVQGLKKKINSYIDNYIQGKDTSKLRIVIKNEEPQYLNKVAEENSEDEY